jgi:hypothetical protein
MSVSDMEEEFRDAKFHHLTEDELESYLDQKLDKISLARGEAHLKRCLICESRLTLLKEERAAMNDRNITVEDIDLVRRVLRSQQPSASGSAKKAARVSAEQAQFLSLADRLAEYWRQAVESWQITFMPEAVRAGEAGEVWRWKSTDAIIEGYAILKPNGDLMIRFSSSDTDLEGRRLKIGLGPLSQETTWRLVSDSEVRAEVKVTRRQYPKDLADITIGCG